jgi:ppGpp synthetase/RelA/SpoT-type nucleotidyltranferase
MKGKVKIVNEGQKFDENRYKFLLDDFDKDGVANVDDKFPFDKGKTGFVEGSPLSESLTNLIDIKSKLDDTMYDAVDKIVEFSPSSDVYARTKTPFSILNKLVKKRLLDPNKGLTDLVGTTIAVDDYSELKKVQNKINNGELGVVLEEEDFYENPNDGYKAIHYIILVDGNQIEVQLKTKRAKEIGEITHKAYKKGGIDVKNAEYLSEIVEKADKGEESSIELYNGLIKDKEEIAKMVTKKMEDGGALSELDDLLKESSYEGTSQPLTYSVTNTGTTPASASISPVSVMAKGGQINDIKTLLDKIESNYCQNLECDGSTRILNYLGKQEGIYMQPKFGAIYFEKDGDIINGFEPHFWNEFTLDGKKYIIDYKAQMWLGNEAPHGVFELKEANDMGWKYLGDSVSLDDKITKLAFNL